MKNISKIRHGAVTERDRRVWRAANSALVFAICVLAHSSLPVKAQYIGDQMLGLTGLKAGSQPGPGLYLALPLYYRDSNISIHDSQGRHILQDLSANIDVIALPAIQVTTPFKILGANYGAGYSQWIINGLLNVAAADFQRSTGYGFGDIYVQPLILGWHTPRADITTGYAFFAPTGKGTSGQHMWVHEIDFGVTLYPDAGKKWNLSTMMYYDFNQKKNNADIKVGDILTLSGGFGRSFLKGAANAGVAYGAQWKMTHDSGSDIPPALPITNGRFFGVGPEIGMPVFAKGLNVGLVSFRYLWIVGPKTALGGQILALSFTFARLKKQ
jgi:hypothetical protein